MDKSKEGEFSDTKSLVSKRSLGKTKIVVSGVVVVVLLLSAMVSMAVYFSLPKQKPARLAEINLKEGETLTYLVDQHIQLQGSDVQQAIIRSIVGIRVLNKTSEEYWFIIKFKMTQLGGDPAVKDHNIMTDYFLVPLQTTSRPSSRTSNKTNESFEVFGRRHIDTELLREVYCILEQLLPVVQRNLYEEVDGQKATGSNSPDSEESPLLPSPVKMHREANTSDKNVVIIRNHFDRGDFVNLSSEIDFDLKYSDSASISKSNGMVTESRAYFSEQLNFGELIHDKSGSDVQMMKISMISQVSLIELTNYFEQAEFERVRVHFFVKLFFAKSKATVSVNETSDNLATDVVSNMTLTPSNNTFVGDQTQNLTESSSIPLKRSRRSSNRRDVDYSYRLFEKKVIGVTVKAEGRIRVQPGVKVRETTVLSVGGRKITLMDKEYPWYKLQNRQPTTESNSWSTGIDLNIPVIGPFSIGVTFRLRLKFASSKSYSASSSSVKFSVQVKPYAEAKASIEGYLSLLVIRAGAYGDGTIVQIALPTSLSLQKYSSRWCTTVSAELTAMKLTAGLYYRWCGISGCGKRNNLLKFGTRAAFRRNWKLIDRCL